MSLALLATTNCDDGQAHALGAVAGEHVAEVAGGHGEADRAAPAGQPGHRGDVVDDLGHDPGPVDGVDRRQVDPVAEGLVGEERLDQVLAVVEGALDGQVVHVGRVDGGHLPPLHVRDPTGRVQDDDLDGVAVAAGVDGGRAGVARGGPDDGDLLARGGPARGRTGGPTSCRATSLKASVGPVEQLGQPQLGDQPQVAQRHHVGMVEGGVGVGDHGREVVAVDRALDEGPHDLDGHLGVGRRRRPGPAGRRPAPARPRARTGRRRGPARPAGRRRTRARGRCPGC